MVLLTITGCPLPGPVDTGPVTDGNRNATSNDTSVKTSGEPNGTFPEAISALFDAGGTARLQGTVTQEGDLDVFELGALTAGDRLVIDTATSGSALDVSVAVFDESGRLTYNNDDRGGSASRFLDSYIDWVVRHSSQNYYLAVTHSAFADPGTLTGAYTVDVRVAGGGPGIAPAQQILVLDFDGASIDSPQLGSYLLTELDAGAISPMYNGQTAQLKEVIRSAFVQNFSRFGVTVLTTDDPLPPEGTEYSTIYFGGFDAGVFGMAESVDLYNFDFCDDAIIFVETFDPQVFSFLPTAEELGLAIGNVGSHEAGHLLGLNHVDDDLALMDDQSAADAFVADQEFIEAPLSADIMSIGTQDAALLLMEIVGPKP